MQNKLLEIVETKVTKNNLPNIEVGSNIKVHVKIKEGNRERIQIFEGLVIRLSNSGSSKTITARKISYGIGVERTFLLNSPLIAKIEILRKNKVRRSKLYYMRDRHGKSARLKEIK